LIGEYIRHKPHIYLYATMDSLKLQLKDLARQIVTVANKSYIKNLSFESFDEAFELIASLELESKLVVVIDEYQNLTKLDKAFSSKLQKAWDMHLSNANIHLILCGSVISMMYSQVLSYSSPLYGRRTTNIHLKPLLFRYIKDFVPNCTKETMMQIYSSFGTIPKYLNEYDASFSFMQNINQKVLDKDAYLYSEGMFLLKEEFGVVEVDLAVEPRQITLDIVDEQIESLGVALKKLGYPFVTESMGFFDSSSTKAKSFVSCAIGKINS